MPPEPNAKAPDRPPALDSSSPIAIDPPGSGTDLTPPPEAVGRQIVLPSEGPTLPPPNERYKIEAEVGRGGMGTVHRAFDEVLKRQVALKATLSTRVDAEVLDRFLEEAQATAQLEHPGIVPVYDMGRDGEGRLYFTMKLVRGRTLASVLDAVRQGDPAATGEYTLFRLLEILIEVARAVSYAHDRGVVHRDLKPQNIMLGAHGEVHVMDWGIAKLLGKAPAAPAAAGARGALVVVASGAAASSAGAASPATAASSGGAASPGGAAGARASGASSPAAPSVGASQGGVRTDSVRHATLFGSVVGTPAYMSPEQARGEVTTLGPASDIYALGTVLFNILTGRPPFEGRSAQEVVAQVASSSPPPLARAFEPSVPRELEAICAKAMAKSPADRYATARALAADVHAHLEGLPVAAYPERFLGRAFKAAKRHRGVTTTIALGIVLALVGSLAALVVIEGARQLAVEREKDARFNLERVRHGHGVAALAEGDARTAATFFASALLLEDHKETRERLIAARARGGRLLWKAAGAEPWAVAVSPDGRRLASGGADGVVHLRETATGRAETRLSGHTGAVRGLAFRPDGKALASASFDGTARIFPLEALSPRSPTLGAASPGGAPGAPAGGAPGAPAPGVPAQPIVLKGHEGRVWAVAWSPDGSRLATAAADRTIRLHDGRTGALLRVLKGHEDEVVCVAFEPNGRRLASGGWDLTVRLWDVETGAELLKLEEHESWVYAVAWTPDGGMLLSAGDAIRLWDPVSGRRLDTIRAHESGIHGIALSPDGRRLATASMEAGVRVFDLDARRVLLTLRGHGAPSEWPSVAFTPDGRGFVTAGLERAVHRWELPPPGLGAGGGRLVAALPVHRREIWAVRYLPDGQRVISSSVDGNVRVLDVESGRALRVWKHTSRVVDISVSDDGALVATAGSDMAARVYDVETGAEVAVLRGHEAALTGVKFCPGGRRVATTGGVDKTARVFDASSGAVVRVIPLEEAANMLTVSLDGRLLATGEGFAVRIYDLETGRPIRTLKGHEAEVDGLAFSPDGKLLASAARDSTVRLWDPATGAALRTLPHGDWAYAVAFRADGKRLATACEDECARIFDVESGALLYTIRGHVGNVIGIAWSPDGGRIVTGGSDRLVRIWELKEIERIHAAPPAALVEETGRETGLKVEKLDVLPVD